MRQNAENALGSGRRPAAAAARLLGPLRSSTRAAAMAAFTATMTQVALLRLRGVPEPRRTRVMQRWIRRWARGLRAVFAVERRLCGEPPPKLALGAARNPRTGRLVVANHRSPLDIILMLECFGGSVLARHDLSAWPVLGRAARESGTMFVDRDDHHSGVKAIREIRRRLAAGQTVIVFPEGTTHGGDQVRPFQGGAFAAARGLPIEVVPVGIAYEPGAEFVDESFAQHVLRVAQRRQTRVAVCVGRAQPMGHDRNAQTASLRDSVQALVARARAELADVG